MRSQRKGASSNGRGGGMSKARNYRQIEKKKNLRGNPLFKPKIKGKRNNSKE